MSVISQFFRNGIANRFTDARMFLRSVSIGNTTTTGVLVEGYGTGDVGAWTELATFGVGVDTNMAADTWKTILNVASGRGTMYGAVSPAIADAGDTISIRVTRDGEPAVTIAEAPAAANYRLFLGHLVLNTLFTVATVAGNKIASMNAGKTFFNIGTLGTVRLAHGTTTELLGSPVLGFETSLLVEMKVTSAQTGTALMERRAGVIYRLET